MFSININTLEAGEFFLLVIVRSDKRWISYYRYRYWTQEPVARISMKRKSPVSELLDGEKFSFVLTRSRFDEEFSVLECHVRWQVTAAGKAPPAPTSWLLVPNAAWESCLPTRVNIAGSRSTRYGPACF